MTILSYINKKQLVYTLAKVRTEFILIDPFREKNRRLSRLLANIMPLQTGQSCFNVIYPKF